MKQRTRANNVREEFDKAKEKGGSQPALTAAYP